MYYLTNNSRNKYADLCNNSGVAKCERGYFLAAIFDFNNAANSDPKHFYAHLNRSGAKAELGYFESAKDDLKKARSILDEMYFIPEYLISQYSAYTDLYNNSGVAKCERGNLIAGINDFDTAIMIDQDNAMAYYNRGLAKIQKGLRISGNADLRKAWDIYNRNTASRWNLPS